MSRAGKLIFDEDTQGVLYDGEASAKPVLFENACQAVRDFDLTQNQFAVTSDGFGGDGEKYDSPEDAAAGELANGISLLRALAAPTGFSNQSRARLIIDKDGSKYVGWWTLQAVATPVRVTSTFAKLADVADKIEYVRVGIRTQRNEETAGFADWNILWGMLETLPSTGADVLDACVNTHAQAGDVDQGDNIYRGFVKLDGADMDELLTPDLTYDASGKTGKALWFCHFVEMITPTTAYPFVGNEFFSDLTCERRAFTDLSTLPRYT